MIDLYHGLSPNVLKVTIFLEEAGLEYRNRSVDLSMGATCPSLGGEDIARHG